MGHDLAVLGAAFLLAGILARLGARIGLPTIPLFMLAGILVGPNTPGPVLFENPSELALLAAMGLIFLLFYLGLEFSIDDLTGGGRKLLLAAGVYLGLNMGCGIAFGFALGWGSREAFVIAGATGISSSAIVTKVLVELRRLANPETRLILGIIVIEDLFLALYLAALAPALGKAETAGEAFLQFGRAALFLIVMAVIARYGASYVGRIVAARDDELLTVSFVGLALLVAGAAEVLGVSDAIGAFMAGLVLSTTIIARRIEKLVLPLRDAFAAVFFFSFGLSIDPGDAASVALPVLAAVLMSTVLAFVAGTFAARLHGLDRLAAANIATTVLARGEFALILVSLATVAGVDERVAPFVAEYVLILALLSPVLAARSPHVAKVLPTKLFPPRTPPATPPAPRPGATPEPAAP